MDLHETLAAAVKNGASDVHFKSGLPPMFRLNGRLRPLADSPRMSPDQLNRIAVSIMNNHQREQFKQRNELDLAYNVPGLGRFRVNVYQQRGVIGIALRVIPHKIYSLRELGLPRAVASIAMEERGLILVTGTTGSGKSSTLASMVDHINCHKTVHVMTIEDPIEFLLRDKRSVINQREIGVDTASFGQALRSALRQDPDVILLGEMRDVETIQTALMAAETGHLVLSTVHTVDASETISRIVSVFPPHQHAQVRRQLGATLRAIISQRLVPTIDNKRRVAALEILRNTPRIREMIEDPERNREINDAIAEGHVSYGMQTFDQALMQHFREEKISYDEALRQAANPNNFELRVQGIESTSDGRWEGFDRGVLSYNDPAETKPRPHYGEGVALPDENTTGDHRVRRGQSRSRGAEARLPRGQTGVFLLPPELRARSGEEEPVTQVSSPPKKDTDSNHRGSPSASGIRDPIKGRPHSSNRLKKSLGRGSSLPESADDSDRDESL